MTADAEDRRLRIDGEPVDLDDVAFVEATKVPVTVEAANMPAPFEVETLEGTMCGDEGDLLIRGVEGELYPCDAEVFHQTYVLEVPEVEDTRGRDWLPHAKRAAAGVMTLWTLWAAYELSRWLWWPDR